MQETRLFQKGDIFCCNFGENPGSVQNGVRPALILQSDMFNAKSPTIIVAPITSVAKKPYLPSHIVLGENYGLVKLSMVMLEQIKVVNKSELGDYIGHIDNEYIWKLINNGIKKTFGLWIYHNNRSSDIRCLCPKCLNDYFNTNSYYIRRVDPYKTEKELCEKCKGYGYDYYVTDKRKSVGG